MNKWHLSWIIPVTILITILLWQGLVINPTDKQHWELTFACLQERYNITIGDLK